MAVITEATAYAIAKNDSMLLAAEEQGLKVAQQMGGMITALNRIDFASTAEAALRASSQNSNLWEWLVYEEVQNIAFEG